MSGITATVFGGTGFLGRYVVSRLGKIGSQIVAPYRGGEDDYYARPLKVCGDLGQVHVLPFDLFDYNELRKLVKHSNVVINLIGQDHNSRHFTMDDVNVSAARLIARAAKAEGVGRLVHVSALNADDMSKSHFFRTKGIGEDAVLEEFPEATIMRPSLMFGAEDRLLNRIASYKSNVSNIVPLIDGGLSTKQPVYVCDVADAIVQSINHPNKVYELVGPKTYTLGGLTKYVSDLLRVKDSTVPVPAPLVMFFARLYELSPLDPLATREEFWRYVVSDKVTESGLKDLGITPTQMEKIGLSYLRRFRRNVVHDEILQY